MLGNLLHAALFPGVIMHELSHYIACIITGTNVSKFKIGFNEAYVKHAKPNSWKMIMISIAPFIIGHALGLIALNEAFLRFDDIFLSLILFWLFLSFIYHSFPSDQDAKNAFNVTIQGFKSTVFGNHSVIIKIIYIILFPFIILPLGVILGIMALFSYIASLRILWILLILLFSLGWIIF